MLSASLSNTFAFDCLFVLLLFVVLEEFWRLFLFICLYVYFFYLYLFSQRV